MRRKSKEIFRVETKNLKFCSIFPCPDIFTVSLAQKPCLSRSECSHSPKTWSAFVFPISNLNPNAILISSLTLKILSHKHFLKNSIKSEALPSKQTKSFIQMSRFPTIIKKFINSNIRSKLTHR